MILFKLRVIVLVLIALHVQYHTNALSIATSTSLPTSSGVAAAFKRFQSSPLVDVVKTPLLESPLINQQLIGQLTMSLF